MVIFITALILSQKSYGQALEAYRTVNSGNFDVPAIWEIFDGADWLPASNPPGKDNDIYIENPHKVTLAANEEVRSVFLNAETDAGEKLDLNGFELHVYGSLNAFEGAAPGTPSGAWNSINWIGSNLDSRLVFKGDSRVIINDGAWNGFTTRSEYTVIFDPGPGVELTMERPFKSNRFMLRSGTLIQKVDGDGNCATFSFNTNPAYAGAYGDLIIEEGATLASECSADITFRSATSSAALFDLQEGGNLVLYGNDPEINAADVILNGNVYYSSASGVQQFIIGSIPGSATSANYHNLFFQGNGQKQLPENLYLTGDMILASGGAVQQGNTGLFLHGDGDQVMENLSLDLKNLEIGKGSGIVTVDGDVKVKENFTFEAGHLDFNGNSLYLNTSGTGSYEYSDGKMSDLATIHYENVPPILTVENSTFPFADAFEGGVRKLQLLGNHGLTDMNLTVHYQQIPGVDWDPNYTDHDGTPVMYQLYSLFSFEGEGLGAGAVELRISADELIVDEVDDLRVVGDHEAAPGDHLSGLDDGEELWARRQLDIADLEGKEFTIGSYRVATILPVRWLDHRAVMHEDKVRVHWSTAWENGNAAFQVFRAIGNVEAFAWVAEVPSKGDLNGRQDYEWVDDAISTHYALYYKIQQVDREGKASETPVFRVNDHKVSSMPLLQVFPNPYQSGVIQIEMPKNVLETSGKLEVKDAQGKVVFTSWGLLDELIPMLKEEMHHFSPGFYLIRMANAEGMAVVKWIKK